MLKLFYNIGRMSNLNSNAIFLHDKSTRFITAHVCNWYVNASSKAIDVVDDAVEGKRKRDNKTDKSPR